MTNCHKNIFVNKKIYKMKKLKIFESKDNMTYSEIENKIKGLSHNTDYSHVKQEINYGKDYSGENKDIKIPLITDVDKLLELNYDMSYTNRAVDTNSLILSLNDSEDVARSIRCYYNDYVSFYYLKNHDIKKSIESSTRLTEEQKSDLNQKVDDRLTDLLEKTSTLMDHNLKLIPGDEDSIRNGYK